MKSTQDNQFCYAILITQLFHSRMKFNEFDESLQIALIGLVVAVLTDCR